MILFSYSTFEWAGFEYGGFEGMGGYGFGGGFGGDTGGGFITEEKGSKSSEKKVRDFHANWGLV